MGHLYRLRPSEWFLVLILSTTLLSPADTCDGYDLVLNRIEGCNRDYNIIKLNKNITFHFTKNCEFTIRGCGELFHDVKDCKVKYNVVKSDLDIPLTGERNACDQLALVSSFPEALDAFVRAKLPHSCPVKKGQRCIPEGYKNDISRFKDKLRLIVGVYTGNFTFECNSGMSCFEFNLEIKHVK